jgi:hypothetical protein
MNFEDESYVRLYTRDTPSWKLLGWEAQTVLLHMLRDRFDRSGVFDCECHDLSHAVTAVTGLPTEIVKAGIARLLESKTWVLNGSLVVWPKYVEAQSCKRSDRARQRESREKRRTRAMSEVPAHGHGESHAVTRGHEMSQPVTPSLAELSLAETPLPPAGVTAAARVSCPADLSLTPDQRGTLETGGIPGWAIDLLTVAFVGKAVADPSDQRLLVHWRKSLSAAISGNWNNPRTRPKRPEPEKSEQVESAEGWLV